MRSPSDAPAVGQPASRAVASRAVATLVVVLVTALVAALSPVPAGASAGAATSTTSDGHADAGTSTTSDGDAGAATATTVRAAGPRTRTTDELRAEHVMLRLHDEARTAPTRFVPEAKEPPVPRLQAWTDLRSVARGWADRMAADQRLAHNPSYTQQICCWSAVAENVAWVGGIGTTHTVDSAADALLLSLLRSPSHRASMLSATYEEVGIGVSIRGERMYATVNLRTRRPGTSPPGSVYLAPAGADATIARACPASPHLPHPFRDVTGGPHAQPIACALAWGIVTGRTATTYEPSRDVTRAQVATMLRRMLEMSGARFDTSSRVRFRDVTGGPHRDAIEVLAGAGIVHGLGGGRFGPDDPVRRDQMASLLVRGLERSHGVVPPTGAAFPDVRTGPHVDAIRRLAGAGITQGDATGRYDPRGTVRRDQMATFAVRTADLLVRTGHTQPPPPARR